MLDPDNNLLKFDKIIIAVKMNNNHINTYIQLVSWILG